MSSLTFKRSSVGGFRKTSNVVSPKTEIINQNCQYHIYGNSIEKKTLPEGAPGVE
jgi:hypothetical protein